MTTNLRKPASPRLLQSGGPAAAGSGPVHEIALGHPGGGRVSGDPSVDDNSRDEHAELLARCRDACRDGMPDVAMRAADALMGRFPDDPGALAAASAAHRAAWRYAGGLELAQRALRVDPGHAQALYSAALCIIEGRDEPLADLALSYVDRLWRLVPNWDVFIVFIRRLLLAGRGDDAKQRLEAFLRDEAANGNPHGHEAVGLIHFYLSQAEAIRGDLAAAAWQSRLAVQSNLIHESFLSTTSMLMARAVVGTTRRRQPSGAPVIGVAGLTHVGRLGHQLNNYISARLYAEKFGYELHTPDWIGHFLFDLDDPRDRAGDLPVIWDMNLVGSILGTGEHQDWPNPPSGARLYSPFFDFWRDAGNKRKIQGMLTMRPAWERRLGAATARLRARGRTCVAVHIRLGDMRLPENETKMVDPRLYLDWLQQVWADFDEPVLYVASDEPDTACRIFAAFAPLTCGHLVDRPDGLDALYDFHVLMNADVVAANDSLFSQTAARLNRRARMLRVVDRAHARIEPFCPWPAEASAGA